MVIGDVENEMSKEINQILLKTSFNQINCQFSTLQCHKATHKL